MRMLAYAMCTLGTAIALSRAKPHHSPACTADPSQAHTAGTPRQSLRGREEVSLYPCHIFAPCLPQQGQWITLIALAVPSPRRSIRRSTTWGLYLYTGILLSRFNLWNSGGANTLYTEIHQMKIRQVFRFLSTLSCILEPQIETTGFN